MGSAGSIQELNITSHREQTSVWDRRGWDGSRERLPLTRCLVGAGAAALAVQGIRQRSVPGAFLAGAGVAIAWWAFTGDSDLSDARRWADRLIDRVGLRRDDAVHEASADSFPASDAPSFTPTVGIGVRSRP
jgi:hypothetical protein